MIYPYSTKEYAAGFSEALEPTYLEHSNTWVLKQAISNTPYYDLKSCYPRYAILSEALNLQKDLAMLEKSGFVSFTGITDAFLCPPNEILLKMFDQVSPFKTHYVLDYDAPIQISKHHRYEIRQSQKNCRIEIISLKDHLSSWILLYNQLSERHNIHQSAQLSGLHFDMLANLDNVVTTAAYNKEGNIISMHLWVVCHDIVYSHLAASSAEGYAQRAAYAIYAKVIEHFQSKKAIDFGSCAGSIDDENDGLARFKRGFANDSKLSYVCGKILDNPLYHQLVTASPAANTQSVFFPKYRSMNRG